MLDGKSLLPVLLGKKKEPVKKKVRVMPTADDEAVKMAKRPHGMLWWLAMNGSFTR